MISKYVDGIYFTIGVEKRSIKSICEELGFDYTVHYGICYIYYKKDIIFEIDSINCYPRISCFQSLWVLNDVNFLLKELKIEAILHLKGRKPYVTYYTK